MRSRLQGSHKKVPLLPGMCASPAAASPPLRSPAAASCVHAVFCGAKRCCFSSPVWPSKRWNDLVTACRLWRSHCLQLLSEASPSRGCSYSSTQLACCSQATNCNSGSGKVALRSPVDSIAHFGDTAYVLKPSCDLGAREFIPRPTLPLQHENLPLSNTARCINGNLSQLNTRLAPQT